ncbi:Complex 1 protein (LYR family)/Complex1 LYR-like [Novymonas esmeraldas]|uniref:Complex 1 protein (LYR family)/Complex1 LYR-like n=1 Tax=Novymonas esmeraldas TaxID=1808958 RepID=A0AAW0EPB8_9TRYP
MSAAVRAVRELHHVAENPYRAEALSWYRRCLRAAFTVPWSSDEDALYVLEETRRLFHQNRGIREVERIERKLREVEMRYEMALHYKIPYPRPFNKMQGSMQESGVPYAAYLDSAYDHMVNPRVGVNAEGSANLGVMGGLAKAGYYFEDCTGEADVEGRANSFDTEPEPPSTMR